MSGETDLHRLVSTMSPLLGDSGWVFCVLPETISVTALSPAPKCTFHEAEGLTVVISPAQADRYGLAYTGVFRCITLSVHSSLHAVGLTAAVSSALASAGISANVIAAYYHDHVFVQEQDAERAIRVLNELSDRHKE